MANVDQEIYPTQYGLLKYKTPRRLTSSEETKFYEKDAAKLKADAKSIANDLENSATPFSSEDILHRIMPPKVFMKDDNCFIQEVSATPSSRTDALKLTDHLDRLLEHHGAKMSGLCPVRRELFSEVFDELIRQLTIQSAERGLLLLRVRNEAITTIRSLHAIYNSGTVFGMQKALSRETDKGNKSERISQLQRDVTELKKTVAQLIVEIRVAEEKEVNSLQTMTKRNEEDTVHLRKTHDQLRAQFEDVVQKFASVR